MTRTKKPFPPPKLADLSDQSAGNYLKLIGRLQNGVTLALGAGVSSSAGIPFWSQLLERMCSGYFEHWEFELQCGRGSLSKPPTNLSIAFAEFEYHTDKAKQLGKNLASKDLLLAAQQIKNCIRDEDFLYLLRHSLYDPIAYSPCSSELIESITRLSASGKVKSLISYNYDDLVAYSLSNGGIKNQLVYEEGNPIANEADLPIHFVHGILPVKGGFSSRIVLAESDYQQESASPFAWGNQLQLQSFASRTCVFLGSSLTDPNVRRLLRLSLTTSNCPHFCFLSTTCSENRMEALTDLDLSRLNVFPIRFPIMETDDTNADAYRRLPELIELATQSLVDESAVWA